MKTEIIKPRTQLADHLEDGDWIYSPVPGDSNPYGLYFIQESCARALWIMSISGSLGSIRIEKTPNLYLRVP